VSNPALWVIDGQNCFVITGGIEHSVEQFAKTLPKQPVTTGEHEPIQVLYHSNSN
jgi:phosphoserine phosphatase